MKNIYIYVIMPQQFRSTFKKNKIPNVLKNPKTEQRRSHQKLLLVSIPKTNVGIHGSHTHGVNNIS